MQRPSDLVLSSFNIQGEPELIDGGEGRTFKIGEYIVRHINNDSFEQTYWTSKLYSQIQENGFRIPKPIKNNSGEWITEDGWTAWKYLEGHHKYEDHIEESIDAINKFHQTISSIPKPDFVGDLKSPWYRADKYAWEQKPNYVHPEVKMNVDILYELRKPIEGLSNQVIHGDLNPQNILLAQGLKPGIIDIAPYYRPKEFALAIYAYWIGPWEGRNDLLEKFVEIPNFKQLLIRAGIRLLLIQSEFGEITNKEKYHQATEIIINF